MIGAGLGRGGEGATTEVRARPRLRRVLVGLVLVALLPTGVFSAALLLWQFRFHQEELRQHLDETVSALAQGVDQKVASTLQRLEILASSDVVPTNPAELERLAHVATDASGDWSSLILARADGQQLLHTGAAPGTALPTLAGRPYLEEALRRRAPVVTDVIPSQLRGKPIVRVVQPILREGEASQVLIVDLELSAFDALLSGRVVREGGIGAILDGEQRFIARSRDSERVLGTVDAALEARLADLEGGFTKLTSPEGVSLYEVWARAPLTGWTVILGVPVAPHEAALQRSLLGLGGAGLALFLLVGLVALTWARRLARSISSATDAAVALAE